MWTASDVRGYLEGYGITSSIIDDAWITARINNDVVPYIEKYVRTSLTSIITTTDYVSGNGTSILLLKRRNPISITAVQLVSGTDITAVINVASLDLISETGEIKIKSGLSEYWMWRIFPKGVDNITVTYTYGYGGNIPTDINEAGIKLTCIRVLDILEGKTGGGDLTVQAHSRQYGNMGKYTHIRKRLWQGANYTLRQYSTSVVPA